MTSLAFTLVIAAAAITVMTAATATTITSVLATTSNNNTNMSSPVEVMDRLGECLVIDDPDEKNECYDRLLEDEYGSG